MVYVHRDPTIEAGVLSLVLRERQKATSPGDWTYRLRNYGYGLSRTARGVYVTTLPHGVEVCRLPDGAAL